MSNVIVGSSRTLRCRFDIDEVPTDPSTVTLTVMDPFKTQTSYTYAAATVTHESTGVYSKNVAFPTEGRWRWRWAGLGACVAADEGVVLVATSPFS